MFITVGTVLLQQGFQVFQAFFFTSQYANDENVFSSRICQVFVLAPSGHASYRVLFVALSIVLPNQKKKNKQVTQAIVLCDIRNMPKKNSCRKKRTAKKKKQVTNLL